MYMKMNALLVPEKFGWLSLLLGILTAEYIIAFVETLVQPLTYISSQEMMALFIAERDVSKSWNSKEVFPILIVLSYNLSMSID